MLPSVHLCILCVQTFRPEWPEDGSSSAYPILRAFWGFFGGSTGDLTQILCSKLYSSVFCNLYFEKESC